MIKYVFLILLTGIASQYAPNKMASVIAVRQIPGKTNYLVQQDLSEYDGFIAMESCAELGNEYYLRPIDVNDWELFLVVDCSGHAETTDWMTRNNIIVEVDYNTAVRWSTVGRGIQVELAKKVSNVSAKHEGGIPEIDKDREHPTDILDYFLSKEQINEMGIMEHLRTNVLDRLDAVNSTAKLLTKNKLSFLAAENLHYY